MRRRLDFGLVYAAPEDDAFEWKKILDEPLLLAMAQDPLADRAVISSRDLHGQRWIALSAARNPQARQRFPENCKTAGFTPDIRLETDDLLAALRLVANGLGVTLVQASLRDALRERLAFRELRGFLRALRSMQSGERAIRSRSWAS